MKLDRDRLTPKGSWIVVRRIRPYNKGLACYSRPKRNDLCSLLALIGPTDLTFLSSTVD